MMSEDAQGAFVTVVKQRLLNLPEEPLRRENSDTLSQLVAAVMHLSKHLAQIGSPQYLADYRTFCFDFTMKVMNSGSLVLRLYAWEQLNELITEAMYSRPVVASYIVSGAGTDFVNGEYKIVPKPVPAHGVVADDHVYSYTKPASPPHVPLLTLFRCTMRTKAKWWFISQADLEKPGTDKDIDYYLHKSGPDDEREPPPRGWTRLNTTVQLRGQDPAPVVKRGNLIIGKNMTRESYYDHQLLELCAKHNLLEHVFGPSIHREVVARCGKLLVFLADYERIRVEDLQVIWKAAMSNTETDIVNEVFSVLVQTAPGLSDELFAALMGLATEALRQPEHFAKVAQFLDKFAVDNFKPVSNFAATGAGLRLLSLVWDTFRDVHFESLKNAPVIQELLSCCLNQKEGAQVVVEKILDCKQQLNDFAALEAGTVPETAAARLVHALYFLVSKHINTAMVEQLQREDLVTCLVIELGRYITANSPKQRSGALETNVYAAHLTDRLNIIRKFYSIHPQLTLPMDTLRSLSGLLSGSSVEQEVFFTFLRHCSKAVIAVRDSLEVFTSFVCSASVDWRECGEEAFECFKTYFCELEGRLVDFPVGTELPPRLGLDTLWRIALNVGSTHAMNSAIELLLQAYDSILFLDEGAYFDLLRVTFSYLENALATASIEHDREPFSPESLLCISRCVNILSTALAKSKGHADPAHAVRGTMHRMHITVFYRRASSYYNSAAQSDALRGERNGEGTVRLEVHPLHTVKELKDRIIELANLGSVSLSLEHPNREFISNATRLNELGLNDGGELSVTYQSSFSAKSYEDDLYADSLVGMSTSKFTHIGQLLSSNFNMFDTLLTLCEMCKDQAIARSIWQLIMLIPTQVDMVQQSVDQVTAVVASDGATWDWAQTLQATTAARTAYLLQIVDNVLQPASELLSPAVIARSLEFREAFVKTNGFAAVLNILITTPADSTVVNSTTLSVALHIVHYMLFESFESDRAVDSLDQLDQTSDSIQANNPEAAELLEQVEAVSAQVIEKLLHVARAAAAEQASYVVHNALPVITKLIKSPEAASELTSNPQSELLLTTVLRSDSKKVREMAAEFAVKVGSTQPVVLKWLLYQLESMQPSDRNCTEIFTALTTLLGRLHAAAAQRGDGTVDGCAELARILSDKLTAYPRKKDSRIDEPQVLLGYLNTLSVLIGLDASAVMATALGKDLVHSFMTEFLFAMPTEDNDNMAICEGQTTRQAAFNALSAFLAISPDGFDTVLGELNSLTKQAARRMHNSWGLQVSHDVRKGELKFSGLKNQGCTCYVNSLLQVLFMSAAFREAVLATPLKDTHRTSLWHKTDVEIVGQSFLFEYQSGMWRQGLVVGFDPVTSRHRVQYTKSDGTSEEIASFNIHEGRFQRETGRVRVIPPEGEEPLSEREESAYRVLDQLQRTFCFMKYSKKRFFDPVELVEACKTLNLNFNVYHQNDAAEFFDQLLDRIETATKGRHTKKDVWGDVFLKNVFGGRWLYQKIPQDCEVYKTKKEDCGHWQSSRLESFLKVELMIRGKEKIEDSLAELMQGELMDGDNKIHCEVCLQKKATVRRTCFGDLPSTLMLHLKRFDLDFQTFETVKLNNRMAFPQRINMLKYTKEGIEAEEKRKQAEQEEGRDAGAAGELQYEVDGVALDPSDYEYELQGVLVHAGVAQGGHYYSFVRDPDTADEWFRFDDDEVTAFDSAHIAVQCFGGPPNHGTSSSNITDEDRTANALMLLYNKVKQPVIAVSSSASSPEKPGGSMTSPTSKVAEGVSAHTEAVLVDGTHAYKREVVESNLQHILTCYLLDPDLHAFVRGMLASITQASTTANRADKTPDGVATLSSAMTKMSVMKWSPQDSPDDLPLRTLQFSLHFLLDVVLHCRERAAIRSYVQVIKGTFEAYPHTAKWFISQVVDNAVCSWFSDFTLHCSDALARGSFVQIVVAAVAVIAPSDRKALAVFKGMRAPDLKAAAQTNEPQVFVALLIRMLLDHTFRSVAYTRSADELFVLIRELSAIPSVCENLLQSGMVAFLSFFIIPELVPPVVRNLFERYLPAQKQQPGARLEFTVLHQSVFDALAAVLGVPQIRKVPLLQDHSIYELVPNAQAALTTIFKECSRNHGMDSHDMVKYFERVTAGTAGKPAPQYLRSIVDRFHTLADGRLSLQGFLEYHAELANSNPKLVWRVSVLCGYFAYYDCRFSANCFIMLTTTGSTRVRLQKQSHARDPAHAARDQRSHVHHQRRQPDQRLHRRQQRRRARRPGPAAAD
jgi:ubiquitin C-terminal hydrolase